MIQGLDEKEFDFLKEKMIFPLKQKGAKVFLFGSRANGKYKKFSDIDLFFIADSKIALPASFIYSLLNDVENSTFPYKVELVKYSEIAKSYLTSINQEKIEL